MLCRNKIKLKFKLNKKHNHNNNNNKLLNHKKLIYFLLKLKIINQKLM